MAVFAAAPRSLRVVVRPRRDAVADVIFSLAAALAGAGCGAAGRAGAASTGAGLVAAGTSATELTTGGVVSITNVRELLPT